MEKKNGALVALIGGILMLIAIFLPWIKILTVEKSAWDAADVIAIASSFMVLLGAIAVWAVNSLKSMVSVGGIFGIAEAVSIYRAYPSVSYGIWIYMVGAIIALIAVLGILSMKE
jgi:uncharacterized membrane protein